MRAHRVWAVCGAPGRVGVGERAPSVRAGASAGFGLPLIPPGIPGP